MASPAGILRTNWSNAYDPRQVAALEHDSDICLGLVHSMQLEMLGMDEQSSS